MSIPILSDTMVLTRTGYRKITDIKQGELVWAYDGEKFVLYKINFRKSRLTDNRWFRFQTRSETTTLFNGRRSLIGISKCWTNIHKMVKVRTDCHTVRANKLMKNQDIIAPPYFSLTSGNKDQVSMVVDSYITPNKKDTISNLMSLVARKNYSVNDMTTILVFNPIIVNGICLEV